MSNEEHSIFAPVKNAFAITGSDTDLLQQPTRGIYVGGSGDVVAVLVGGDEVTFTSLVAGVIHPIRAKQIKSTNTTATSIIGVY